MLTLPRIQVESRSKPEIQFDSDKITEIKEILNEEQTNAFDDIIEFLQDRSREYYLLEGYAGTGKTFTLSRIISAINDPQVVLTAPTNKAVKVLMDNKSIEQAEFMTIHKLLALTMKKIFPKKAGREPYLKLVRKNNTDSLVNNYSIVIVDECSMLNDELFEMLDTEKRSDVKVIFTGDPAQIPPVNQTDAIVLRKEDREKHNIGRSVLYRIMRQTEGSTIAEIGFQIRNNRFHEGDPILSRKSSNDVKVYKSTNKESLNNFMQTMLAHFVSEKFIKDSNYAKVIAWRNVTVDNMNKLIRQHIYKGQKLDLIMPGEKLIANKPIIEDETIIFNSSDEFEVLSYEIKTEMYIIPERCFRNRPGSQGEMFDEKAGYEYRIEYYRCLVKFYVVHSRTWSERYIDIPTAIGIKGLLFAISKLKKLQAWREYYRLSERFANTKYNYAITAHKSQGSTYDHVFIIEDDMDFNKRNLERNRIKYTACTRPSKFLHILSAKNSLESL